MDVKKYYQDIKVALSRLEPEYPDGWLYVVSLDIVEDDTPRMFAVTVRKAAQLIVDRTHRVATEDEVKAWELLSQQKSDEIKREQALKDKRSVFINATDISQLGLPVESDAPQKASSLQKKGASKSSEGGK